jgi:general secretion pathway protein D
MGQTLSFSPRLLRLPFLLGVTLIAALAGCKTVSTGKPTVVTPTANPAPAKDLPRLSKPVPLVPETSVAPLATQSQIIAPSGASLGPIRTQTKAKHTGEVQLSFVDADIKTVLQTLLGDTLGLNYTIDPAVSGTLTLQASRPLRHDQVLPALEAALRLREWALVRNGEQYIIMPLKEAVQRGAAAPLMRARQGNGPGFAVEIVPLRYIGAGEAEKILTPFAVAGSIVRIDKARNLLMLAGTSQERENLRETLHMFDVDWMRGRAIGIFKPRYSGVDALEKELREIFQTTGAPLGEMVSLVALPRIGTLFAFSQQADYLQDVRTWIERLDQGGGGGVRSYVYAVQHGKAASLAESLKAVFTQGRLMPTSPATPSASTFAPLSPDDPMFRGPPTSVSESPQGDASDINIVADERSNSLLILASPEQFRLVSDLLAKLDVTPLQVMIEASIAEVTLNDELRFGVQWFLQSESGKHQLTLTQSALGTVGSVFPGFSYVLNGDDAKVALNALDSVTKVDVLSSPKLMVLNNQTATLQVGDQVPIVTQSAVSTVTTGAPIVNSVQLKDTGVILKVTPRINTSGMVQMDVAQEVSDVAPTTTSNIDSPTIQQRKIDSTVVVGDGETVALGGLMRDNRRGGREGIVFLGDLPVVGSLFRYDTVRKARTELLVFITPRVIRSPQDARQTTQDLRAGLQNLQLQQAGHAGVDDDRAILLTP